MIRVQFLSKRNIEIKAIFGAKVVDGSQKKSQRLLHNDLESNDAVQTVTNYTENRTFDRCFMAQSKHCAATDLRAYNALETSSCSSSIRTQIWNLCKEEHDESL